MSVEQQLCTGVVLAVGIQEQTTLSVSAVSEFTFLAMLIARDTWTHGYVDNMVGGLRHGKIY